MVKVSALKINEIESNPEGEDSGFEWIEFYSEEEVNLEGYYLDHEGRGANINLTGIFSGFFVLNLPTQWLRNSNETVYLKSGENILQTIGPFSDNKLEKTYNLCEDSWEFMASSKEQANLCQNNLVENEVEIKEEDEKKEDLVKVEEKKENITQKYNQLSNEKYEEKNTKKISLVNQNEASYEITRTYKTRMGVIYFFIGFCTFLVVLIAMKKL